MSDVVIYHPGTGATAAVHPEAVPHHRRAGWLLLSEHQQNQADQQAAVSAAPKVRAAERADEEK